MSTPFSDSVHPFTIKADPGPESSGPGSPVTHEPVAHHEPVVQEPVSHHDSVAERSTATAVRIDEPETVPGPSFTSLPAPPAEHKQAIDLVSRMLLVAQETKANLNNRLAEFDLNDIRYSVLSIVREAAAEGCSQSMLAQKLRQSESSISTLVDRMRTSGLLYRLRSKTDRRKRYLTLTERGRQLLVAVDAKYGACVDDILGTLSNEDRAILGVILKRLLAQLDGETTTPSHSKAA